jgi:hypothetical protein
MSRGKPTWMISVARTDAKNSSVYADYTRVPQNVLSVGSSKLSEYAAAVVELGFHLGPYNLTFSMQPERRTGPSQSA